MTKSILAPFFLATVTGLSQTVAPTREEPKTIFQGDALVKTVDVKDVTQPNGKNPTTFDGTIKDQKVIVVKGKDLEEGRKYTYANSLVVIDGSIPKATQNEINGGKLVVTEGVGDKAKLTVTRPDLVVSYTEREKGNSFWKSPLGSHNAWASDHNGSLPVKVTKENKVKDVNLGPAYPNDKDPEITILGKTGKGAILSTNGEIYSAKPLATDVRLTSPVKNDPASVVSDVKPEQFFIAPLIKDFLPKDPAPATALTPSAPTH